MTHSFMITLDTLDIITKFEGFCDTIYACPAGKPTIGFGHIVRETDYFTKYSGAFLLHSFYVLQKKMPNRKQLNQILADMFSTLITQQTAMNLLKSDLLPVINSLNKAITTPLTQKQSSSLLSLVHNIGITAFKHSTMLKYINMNQMADAANEFDKWIYIGKKPSSGLIKRRYAEKILFLQPEPEEQIIH